MLSFAMQKLFSFMKSHLLVVDLSVYANGSVQKVFFPASEFKAIPYFLFYQTQSI